jgi:hypothetical protein
MLVLKWFFTACVLTAMSLGPAAAAEWGTQKNSQSGVAVDVTDLAAGAKTSDFKLVLDTHSQDLNDDLTKTAVLLDPSAGRCSNAP